VAATVFLVVLDWAWLVVATVLWTGFALARVGGTVLFADFVATVFAAGFSETVMVPGCELDLACFTGFTVALWPAVVFVAAVCGWFFL
jgi:hypothetical protein